MGIIGRVGGLVKTFVFCQSCDPIRRIRIHKKKIYIPYVVV